jgi:hypothetical protein
VPDAERQEVRWSAYPSPWSSSDSRPPLLRLGIALLVANEVLLIGACAIGGVLGSIAILLGSGLVVAIGALAAFVLATVACFAVLSLGVCAMAWRGSRAWVGGLVVVALVNCIVLIPNPLGILAAVFCVLGALEFLEKDATPDKIHSVEKAAASDPAPVTSAAAPRSDQPAED